MSVKHYIKGGTQAQDIWKQVLRQNSEIKLIRMGECRTLNSEAFHGLYYSPKIIRVTKSIKWKRKVCWLEVNRSAFSTLPGKPIVKRLLGKRRRRWDGNIRMDFLEIHVNTNNWIDSAQDRSYWKCGLNLHKPGINYIKTNWPGLNLSIFQWARRLDPNRLRQIKLYLHE